MAGTSPGEDAAVEAGDISKAAGQEFIGPGQAAHPGSAEHDDR